MAPPFLPSCVFPCVLGVLVCITAVGSSGVDWYRYRFTPLTPTEQELQELYTGPGTRGTQISPHPLLPPYLLLPMFRQQPAPFTSKPLFRPSVGTRVLPSTLENILIPQNLQEDQTRALPVSNDRGVEVWCGYSKLSVRVNLALLGFRSSARQFRFGTCEVSRSDGSFIYFHHDLNSCGGSFSIVNEQLIYSNNLVYKPDPQGSVIRSLPLILNIQCVYNRFHYSYKIGYIPDVGENTFRKRLSTRGVFSLSVYNEMWEKSSVNESFTLGQQMNFEASVDFTWEDQSLFVEACHATESNDPNSSPRYHLITNSGCLVDSKMTGSQSHFVLRQKNILRFSIDAFLFPQSTSEVFYLHCSLSVGNSAASSTSKSCTYSKEQSRWVELDGDANICNCCDSSCVQPAGPTSASSSQRAVVTSDAWSLNLHKFLLRESEADTEPEDEMVVHHLHDINDDEEEEEEVVEDYELEEVLIGNKDFKNNTMMRDQQAEDDEGNLKVENAEQKQQLEVLVGEMKKNEGSVNMLEQENMEKTKQEENEQGLEIMKDEDVVNETVKQEEKEEEEQEEEKVIVRMNGDAVRINKELEKNSEEKEELGMNEDAAEQRNVTDLGRFLEMSGRGDVFLQENMATTIPEQDTTDPVFMKEELFLQSEHEPAE